jgi:tripartite-type tricarboxylate transporter receptor subunit TctC
MGQSDPRGQHQAGVNRRTFALQEGKPMKFPRREFLRLVTGAAALPFLPRAAFALDYPTRPVRLILGFPPASATDIVARLIAQSLSERLGQQVIVDNRPGAGSNIGTEAVVRSPPDGYTILAATVTNAVNATLYQDLNFDFAREIAPVAGTFRSPNALVVTQSLPAQTLPEFIAYAKANPGKINYASFGYGTAPNMAAELFKMMAGVDLVHVPYRGNYLPDLIAGQVQVAFNPIALSIEQIKAGKLRVLAVTGTSRSNALPDVPTVAEFVPGYAAIIWHGIGVPKDTPPAIINKLNAEINAALADPVLKARFAELGGTSIGGTPGDFGRLIAAEIEKWGKVVRAANIKPE